MKTHTIIRLNFRSGIVNNDWIKIMKSIMYIQDCFSVVISSLDTPTNTYTNYEYIFIFKDISNPDKHLIYNILNNLVGIEGFSYRTLGIE